MRSHKTNKAFLFNPGTETSGVKGTVFNEIRWGKATRDYAASVMALGKKGISSIAKEAHRRTKNRKPNASQSTSTTVSGPSNSVDRRALLVDTPLDGM